MDGMEKWNVYIEYEIGNNNYIKIYKIAKHPVSRISPAERVEILVKYNFGTIKYKCEIIKYNFRTIKYNSCQESLVGISVLED